MKSPPLPEEEAERMADQYGMSPETVKILYAQQAQIARQKQSMEQIAYQIRERKSTPRRGACRRYSEEEPNAPGGDEQRLVEFRRITRSSMVFP